VKILQLADDSNIVELIFFSTISVPVTRLMISNADADEHIMSRGSCSHIIMAPYFKNM
jgi:hypothetical protein